MVVYFKEIFYELVVFEFWCNFFFLLVVKKIGKFVNENVFLFFRMFFME